MSGLLPIIYIRGFAGGQGGIDRAVADPLYGFNEGSTHVRVNGEGDAVYYQFESPILRLIGEHDYHLLVNGGQEAYLRSRDDGDVESATIWIHRFYDRSSSLWGNSSEEFSIEAAARNLLGLTELVLAKTAAERVHLVAHSMGGLIARSMLQKVIPELYGGNTQGPGSRRLAAEFVDRLFTYGTPHGGIEFALGKGLIERLRDATGVRGADVFGPTRMYQYLTPGTSAESAPPENWDSRVMPDDENFPLSRVFCLIGTNAGDYAVAGGLPARAVGAKSDGLVQIENALVAGPGAQGRRRSAEHAFVHRSHSGLAGMVNSEEGYHNLSRFLLGDIRVTAELVDLELPYEEELSWQVEAQVSIRGLPTLMHERTAANYCPILVEKPDPENAAHNPVPIVTTYLSTTSAKPSDEVPMRFTLRLRLLSLRERGGLFHWVEHLEQVTDFDDTLIIDVQAVGANTSVWAVWASSLPTLLRDYAPEGEPLTDQEPEPGVWVALIPLPRAGGFLGPRAAVKLTCRSADG